MTHSNRRPREKNGRFLKRIDSDTTTRAAGTSDIPNSNNDVGTGGDPAQLAGGQAISDNAETLDGTTTS